MNVPGATPNIAVPFDLQKLDALMDREHKLEELV